MVVGLASKDTGSDEEKRVGRKKVVDETVVLDRIRDPNAARSKPSEPASVLEN
jgi:hypothetical protein